MAPEHMQRIVDAAERESAQRYEHQRRLREVVDDAARRADAMSRLDAWLRYHPERPARET